jgi:hypothetical protein
MGEMTDKTSVMFIGNLGSEINAVRFAYQLRVLKKKADKGMS